MGNVLRRFAKKCPRPIKTLHSLHATTHCTWLRTTFKGKWKWKQQRQPLPQEPTAKQAKAAATKAQAKAAANAQASWPTATEPMTGQETKDIRESVSEPSHFSQQKGQKQRESKCTADRRKK